MWLFRPPSSPSHALVHNYGTRALQLAEMVLEEPENRLRTKTKSRFFWNRLVRVASRTISPPWGSIRFRLALRTYAPWGVRVVGRTKSRKIPTRNMLPLFSLSRYTSTDADGDGVIEWRELLQVRADRSLAAR